MSMYFQISVSLSEFHAWVVEVIRHACEEALQAEEFVPDPIDIPREGVCVFVLCECV